MVVVFGPIRLMLNPGLLPPYMKSGVFFACDLARWHWSQPEALNLQDQPSAAWAGFHALVRRHHLIESKHLLNMGV